MPTLAARADVRATLGRPRSNRVRMAPHWQRWRRRMYAPADVARRSGRGRAPYVTVDGIWRRYRIWRPTLRPPYDSLVGRIVLALAFAWATRSTTASNSGQLCTSVTPTMGSFQGCTMRQTVASGKPVLNSSS